MKGLQVDKNFIIMLNRLSEFRLQSEVNIDCVLFSTKLWNGTVSDFEVSGDQFEFSWVDVNLLHGSTEGKRWNRIHWLHMKIDNSTDQTYFMKS